jgi:glyoxylase-like metal-dependent hydrolase (beta-lactamase superfamily II)
MLLLFLALPAPLFGQDEVVIKTIPVADGIYMMTGKGGNMGLFIGEDGTFLIDDQFAPLTEKHLAAIKEAGGDVPRFLINTHYHGDHTGGNENLGTSGTLIFSHDNVRRNLTMETIVKAFNMTTPPQPKEALPVVTFSQDITFHLNDETVQAFHVPNAHTDGDSVIHFIDANVIHTGDTLFNGFYPFIDVDNGGTVKGMIAAVDRMLALADDKTKIIPGHGPLAGKADAKAFRDMLQTAYEKLSALKKQGKTAEEAVAAKPLADLEGKWGKGMFTGDKWVGIVYDLAREKRTHC